MDRSTIVDEVNRTGVQSEYYSVGAKAPLKSVSFVAKETDRLNLYAKPG